MTKLFKSMWYGLDLTRKIFLNVIFFGVLVFIVIGISNSDGKPTVEKGIALVLAPNGNIVEQLTYSDPVDKALQEATGNEDAPETLLYDLIFALDQAKDDDRITMLVISTSYLWGVGMTKMQDLAVAIEDFKTSGKPVIAYSDYYSQGQYFIASQADEVVMNPQGGIFLTGFSRVGTYFKGMLDNLGVNVHVFKVGKFKSAVEPFLRNNMSDEAKEANLLWMGDLWQDFKIDLAKNRGLTPNDLDSYIENYKESLIENKGDSAVMALNAGLVDRLATRIEFRDEMIEKTGMDSKTKSFRHISHQKYIKAIRSPISFPANPNTPKVAVITTKGTIVDGEAKEGTIGGDTIARLIRKTRNNKNVKAIVLRVDSGGGSAFASEVIREELVKAQADGIKVVASMGDVAASGGYWISASSDEIWAMSTTITGSIGIFGMLPTFEKPLNDFGIYRDGVGTTKYSNPVDVGMPLSDDVAMMIQTGIDSGYQKFIGLVARSRNMTLEEVDKIAQGRVWSGKRAKDLGLVDQLGSLNDAIESAAKLAGLDNYDILNVKRKLTENEKFLKELFNQSQVESLMQERQQARVKPNIKSKLFSQFKGLMSLTEWNDPNNAYVNCFCEIQ
ncbi:MAG: signal peptide peptidase SppA [Gammaproteobacteria bacterium]|nr:MAG: signal peptide peptidase SppA [Gammaproteobacteria bacterium]